MDFFCPSPTNAVWAVSEGVAAVRRVFSSLRRCPCLFMSSTQPANPQQQVSLAALCPLSPSSELLREAGGGQGLWEPEAEARRGEERGRWGRGVVEGDMAGVW